METAAPIKRIGIISGVANELAAFLPDHPRAPLAAGAFTVEHLNHAGKEIYLLCAGIGKVAAAVAATTLHAHFSVDLLLVIGTAGKIGDMPGDLFGIVEAVQADYGAQRSGGLVHYTAGTMPIGVAAVEAFRAFAAPAPGLTPARIATSDLFIECDIHAGKVRDGVSATLVDMETAAVAQAAGLLGVPWAAIKATTDAADGDSATAFFENLEAAARSAADAARRLIEAL
jgi:adenosylhomocysteine nucleosidase